MGFFDDADDGDPDAVEAPAKPAPPAQRPKPEDAGDGVLRLGPTRSLDGCPAAMESADWAAINPGLREEAKRRFSHFIFRGFLPAEALQFALATIEADEAETEIPVDWTILNALLASHPQPARDPFARPLSNILQDSATLTSLVSAELEAPGCLGDRREYLAGLGMQGKYLDAAKGALDAALALVGVPASMLGPAGEDDGAGGAKEPSDRRTEWTEVVDDFAPWDTF